MTDTDNDTNQPKDILGMDPRVSELARRYSEKQKYFGMASLKHIEMPSMDLFQVSFYGSDLSGANLQECSFKQCNFSRANLSNADLTGADLTWGKLIGTNLSGAKLTLCDLKDANLVGANMCNTNLLEVKINEKTCFFGEKESITEIAQRWQNVNGIMDLKANMENYNNPQAKKMKELVLHLQGKMLPEASTVEVVEDQKSNLGGWRMLRLNSEKNRQNPDNKI